MEKTAPNKNEKRYVVEYWEHTAMDIEVYASSPEEAEEKARLKVENGDVDFSNMEVGDSGYEVIEQ